MTKRAGDFLRDPSSRTEETKLLLFAKSTAEWWFGCVKIYKALEASTSDRSKPTKENLYKDGMGLQTPKPNTKSSENLEKGFEADDAFTHVS